MPELVSLKTAHFECVIWTKDIALSQQRLHKTMQDRHRPIPTSVISFRPAVLLANSEEKTNAYHCSQALFFENKQYDIEFIFDDKLEFYFEKNEPYVTHRLKSVEDAFHYSARHHGLRATINTANNVGWFCINLHYQIGKQQYTQAIAFEVLPTKIDMVSDINQMNRLIDEHYPLWRFSLAEKTHQNFSTVKKPQPRFLLLWLAQFEQLRQDLDKGLKHIVNAPHSRLINVDLSVKVDRLKGKLNPKLEAAVQRAQCDGVFNKRFSVKKKQLSLDTPENRFIKSVVKMSTSQLMLITRTANENQQAPDAQRLSASFFTQLAGWQASLKYFQHHPMFKYVGEFTGFSCESLVLQQKPGYAKVYRIWQELKYYLDLLGDDASLSLRNVAQLYEVWCFLEVRKILLELGFNEVVSKKAHLVNRGLGVSMRDGFAGAFKFERDDGICLRLVHEPLFKKNTRPIKIWLTPQQPDILLEATFADGSEFIWLFDAKYRIKSDEGPDLVPDDAINQLHRYRDALIHKHKSTAEKTRPIFGAYALYPGYFEQAKIQNPYEAAIEEIGIGAFSLLPNACDEGCYWLKAFLKRKLGDKKTMYTTAETDRYFVEEGVRIPYKGTSITRYSDLTAAVNGMVSGRTKAYRQNLSQGGATFYHMKLLASERQNIEQHIIKEIRYLAIAVKVNASTHEVAYLYPVLNVEQMQRQYLTEEQTGSSKYTDATEPYWLFTLGKALQLKAPIEKPFTRQFKVKLTSAAAFDTTENWRDLPNRYEGAY